MNKRYDNLDGLRAFSAIGIVLMHIRSNGSFAVSGFFYDKVISSFTNLVYLFMTISAFSMCCGYYEQVKSGKINIDRFYKKRYHRVLPFFSVLCTIELLIDHSLKDLYEWFADLTLVFGLLPKAKISVVGVGWFLGTVFVFYLLFPFYVFLLHNKRRAWGVMAVSIIYNIVCRFYFLNEAHVGDDFLSRSNIIYSSMFFLAGGIIYLYKDELTKIKYAEVISIILSVGALAVYYTLLDSEFILLVLFSLFLIYGVTGKSRLLNNRIVKFISSVSMEIYLCHMFVFRFLEKIKMIHFTSNEVINYIIVSIVTLGGAMILSLTLKKAIELFEDKLKALRNKSIENN